MTHIPPSLIKAYKDGRLILFVGSGISKNLNLPSWSDLIGQLAKELGYDEDIYNTFGDYLALAEYYCIEKSIKDLCARLNNEWHTKSINIRDSEIHKFLVQGNFPIIYTTNYDCWLENAFAAFGEDFDIIRNVSDLNSLRPNVRKIVKFHGDFSDPSTIVLGETSYYDRLNFESPLDIKFRADLLDKEVLFIGYSLSDINIRFLFYKFSKLWKTKSTPSNKFSSYIFTNKYNPIQEKILKQWKIKMINPTEYDPSLALKKFLQLLISK